MFKSPIIYVNRPVFIEYRFFCRHLVPGGVMTVLPAQSLCATKRDVIFHLRHNYNVRGIYFPGTSDDFRLSLRLDVITLL